MPDIIENLKDAINPHRREQATVPDYDPQKRGPYADKPPNSQPGVEVPRTGLNDSTTSAKSVQLEEAPTPSSTKET